jgi:ABC-2 type transport system ATP-binding protein
MLAVKNLAKYYGEKQVLHDVQFNIEAGEVVALLGANGSGKTTIIRSICRLLEWEQGEIEFEQTNIKKSSSYLRHIGAVLDGSRNTHFRLTAKQNARYFAKLRGADPKQFNPTIDHLHSKLGLDQYSNYEVGKLSTGNKQKTALLCALSHQPKLLLLDEPTLGLDMDTVAELQQTIAEQAKTLNQSFLITSHDLGFIDQICTRVMVLDQGKIIFNGAIEQLKQSLHNYECQIRLTPEQCAQLTPQLSQLWQVSDDQISVDDSLLTVHYDLPEQSFATIQWLEQQSIKPLDLTIKPLSIETAYRSLLTTQTDNKEQQL